MHTAGFLATQNVLFLIVFGAVIFFSLKKHSTAHSAELFSYADSIELKGLAFCMVLFAHIGYFLFPQWGWGDQFLYPLSILGGVAVNLFLFLSGYGLAQSARTESPWQFYKRRFFKLYTPLWLSSLFIVALDIIGKKQISFLHALPGFTGVISHADLYTDFNSPLWFLTLLFLFYLVFPWIYKKEHPVRSAAFLLVFGAVVPGWLVLYAPFDGGVIHLWLLHALAFPLGVIIALGARRLHAGISWMSRSYWIRIPLFMIALSAFVYFAVYSGVNTPSEEPISIVILFLFLLLFLLAPFRSRLFRWLGIYSYEMYLIHWPLLFRHDILFFTLPAWFATVAYMAILLAIGFVMAWVSKNIFHLRSNISSAELGAH